MNGLEQSVMFKKLSHDFNLIHMLIAVVLINGFMHYFQLKILELMVC